MTDTETRTSAEHKALEIRDALGESDLFGSLFDAELDSLIQFGKSVTHHEGKTIFLRGDRGDSLMIVLSGRVKISNMSADGKEVMLNFIEPGHCFGEIAMLDGKDRTADATAMENCELFVLRSEDMIQFIEQHPEIVWRAMGVLCAKLRRTTRMVEDSVLFSMEPRIARGLLRLAQDYGRRSGDDIRIELRLSQRELGSYVGLARENVNRQLSAWRESGVLSIDKGFIVIHDMARLKCAAGG